MGGEEDGEDDGDNEGGGEDCVVATSSPSSSLIINSSISSNFPSITGITNSSISSIVSRLGRCAIHNNEQHHCYHDNLMTNFHRHHLFDEDPSSTSPRYQISLISKSMHNIIAHYC